MTQQQKTPVYSYHTFYFPFVWDNAGKLEFEDYINCLEAMNRWNDISVHNLGEASDNVIANYQTLQYYTDMGRKSLFGWNSDFVRCYEYVDAKADATYHIEAEKDYKLRLYGIKLKIYNTGIGILTFEVENSQYKSLADVKAINEHGRRIYPPYQSPLGCSLCAKKLGTTIKGKQNFSNIAMLAPTTLSDCIPDFISSLLPDTKILPAIDDRMFVACLINDTDAFQSVMNYKTEQTASKSLYELLYIDKENNCTCPTESMRSELLERSVYRRWLENKDDNGNIAGTLFGVTHHSFVGVTTATDPYIIEIPFLSIYTHMVSVVLAQRATIIAFDARVSELSAGFEKKGTILNRDRIKTLKELQEKYIAFLNQHMNIELTCQEQGNELYALLQQEMYITNETASLSDEISRLSEAANTANESKFTLIALWIAWIPIVMEFLPIDKFLPWLYHLFIK